MRLRGGGEYGSLTICEGKALSAAYEAFPGIYAKLSKGFGWLLRWTARLCSECGFAKMKNMVVLQDVKRGC